MQLLATLTIDSITNIRELAGDQLGPVRFAINLGGEIPADAALTLYASEKDREQFMARYWTPEGDLNITHTDDTVALEAEIKLGEASISSALGATPAMKFLEADLKKIKMKPLHGRKVDLSASLQIRPADDQMARLLNMLKTSAAIVINRRQGELPLEDPKKAAKAPKQPDILEEQENADKVKKGLAEAAAALRGESKTMTVD